ncbi:kinase inhibitor [Enterobacter kobei]|jgi:Raf kinase inhibitor-like YbhB/YbcL family protein|uniref:kinase inhibitor n=1 Tax=Enterobacter kobei TaxID=208224 RepID=UPI001E6249D8|nr:kinase inhibitor [Enterobacter kobei]MCE1262041.1 kinase inhibitor [Enterobacter kobei]MCE1359908.1 kinase inhibitor [Enterobacter kobei]
MKKRNVIVTTALAAISFQVLAATPFSITSQDISGEHRLAQQQVFNGFGCHGDNQSPQLAWKHPPAGTKSFAITVYDPDAPTGSGWWHWTVANIPAKTMALPAGAGNPKSEKLPAGAVQGRNDFGYSGFGGACPPEGDKPHRYQITVWALNVDTLPLDNNASGALVGYMINSHVLGKTQLTATYSR